LGRPDRKRRLIAGIRRLLAFDCELLLVGLRLFPHVACRTAETLGPLPEAKWEALQSELAVHRLWQVGSCGARDAFWQAVEILERHRELPQPILDYLESGRPRDQAPWPEFGESLARFLVRARLEKVRGAVYAWSRGVPTR
jgi:hypothetical protein